MKRWWSWRNEVCFYIILSMPVFLAGKTPRITALPWCLTCSCLNAFMPYKYGINMHLILCSVRHHSTLQHHILSSIALLALSTCSSTSTSHSHRSRSWNVCFNRSSSSPTPSKHKHSRSAFSLLVVTTFWLRGRRTVSYPWKAATTCLASVTRGSPRSSARTWASSMAWPAPAPWCGVDACAASPRMATRERVYVEM